MVKIVETMPQIIKLPANLNAMIPRIAQIGPLNKP
jgi:hypothetical protein